MASTKVRKTTPASASGRAVRTPSPNGRAVRSSAALSDPIARALFEDTDSAVLRIDVHGRVQELNAAAGRLFGVSAARARGAVASTLVRTLIPGDDPVAQALASPRIERDLVLATREGEVPVLLRGYRLTGPTRLVLVLRDLTQVRRMQQELRRNERLATLGQLAAGVAHEIRNPLAGIGTSAQVLMRRFEPRDERARFVKVILDEVARLDRIVTSLLQYARPRTPELSARALAPCIDRVLEFSAESLTQAGVRVEVEVTPRLAPVYIDADLVTQVLLNVTLNAVQAMPRGGTVRYEVRRVRRRRPARGPGRRNSDARAAARPRADWIEFQQIRVIDTGTGMSKGVLAKLFHPFFSTKPRGTGLGMAISQTIMQEHGGVIEVTSREGHGTTVLLLFPTEKRHGARRDTDAHAGGSHASHRR